MPLLEVPRVAVEDVEYSVYGQERTVARHPPSIEMAERGERYSGGKRGCESRPYDRRADRQHGERFVKTHVGDEKIAGHRIGEEQVPEVFDKGFSPPVPSREHRAFILPVETPKLFLEACLIRWAEIAGPGVALHITPNIPK